MLLCFGGHRLAPVPTALAAFLLIWVALQTLPRAEARDCSVQCPWNRCEISCHEEEWACCQCNLHTGYGCCYCTSGGCMAHDRRCITEAAAQGVPSRN